MTTNTTAPNPLDEALTRLINKSIDAAESVAGDISDASGDAAAFFSGMDDWYFEAWLDRLGHVEYISDQRDLDYNNIHMAFFVSLLWHSCVL